MFVASPLWLIAAASPAASASAAASAAESAASLGFIVQCVLIVCPLHVSGVAARAD
jgi:hypothetical protein